MKTTLMTAAAILVVLGLRAAASQAVAPATFDLPPVTGRYAVGTTAWRLTDRSRQETFTASGEFRQVEVLAWYPAAASRRGRRAPYLREGLAEVQSFATLFGAATTAFDGLQAVRTHAELDAAPAVTPAKFPVLVFSHGYTGIPSAYTALLEDLASHGYAVLSVVHPYEASAATLADGRVVSMLDKDGKLLSGIQDVFAEWNAEDQTMASVTRTEDRADQLRLLRGYLGGLHHTDIALKRWVDDTKLVLDRLSSLAPGSAGAKLAARLDVSRLGVFGHSMGGVAAGQVCVEDRRCRAGLNLDGIPQYGTMIDTPGPRPFLMIYSARPGRLGASDAIYTLAASPYYRIDVRDTRHLDFSDMTFWGGPLRQYPVLGAIAPGRVTEITRTLVRQYFDQELRGERSTLVAATSRFPEVTLRTPTPAAR
jgi:Platelet-activating factor acetylhydrolase, isoform II